MKTRIANTTEETKLILWGLKLRNKQEHRRVLGVSAEPINRFFEYADTTIANLSNLVTGSMPLLHISLSILVNVLNSIPWVSVILTTLNGLFRAVRALVIKEIDPNKHYSFGLYGAYAKRIWLAAMGIAGVALGLASMFVATLAIPITIAATMVDTLNNIVKFGESLKRCISPAPGQSRMQEIKRMLNKLENFTVSAMSLTGTILLFTPLMPLGAGLLIASSLYAILDKYNVNPFKRAYSGLKKKFNPAIKQAEAAHIEPVDVEKPLENSPEEKEKRAALFDKLYCQPTTKTPKPTKAEEADTVHTHPTRHNPMKLFQESKKRMDITTENAIQKSFRLR